MKSPDGNYFGIDRRLTLTAALLIVLILGGNGLVILQFQRARLQTDRLTGVSQELIAVLRLQKGLLSFHQRLDELAQARDAHRLVAETQPLRMAILAQAQRTRTALSYLPPEFVVDPEFLTALDAFETTLPSQLQDITALGRRTTGMVFACASITSPHKWKPRRLLSSRALTRNSTKNCPARSST